MTKPFDRRIRTVRASICFCLCLILPRPVQAIDDHTVDNVVVKAVQFLATQQQANGSFSADPHRDSTAVTSLAIMAFLAAGHVPGEGSYGTAVEQGVQFILKNQDNRGMLVTARGHGPMYDHGISTLMLAEVAGMTGEPLAVPTRRALEKAVKLILIAQNVRKPVREHGGWRYQHSSQDSDLSVTAWQLLALRAAKDIGCDVPVDNINRAVDYVLRCSTAEGFSYQPGGSATNIMTASGTLALQLCDHQGDEIIARGMGLITRRPLRYGDGRFFYGAYYDAVSCHKYGGEVWEDVKTSLFQELCARQQPSGEWAAGNNDDSGFGSVYTTSFAILALTVEYGYLPIYQR